MDLVQRHMSQVETYLPTFVATSNSARPIPESSTFQGVVKAITTSLHSRSVLGRVIVESLTKELQLKRTFGCE